MGALGSARGGAGPRALALFALGLALAAPAGADGAAAGERTIPDALREAVERFVRERAAREDGEVQIPPLADFDLPGLSAGDVEIDLSGGEAPHATGALPVTAVLSAGGQELKRGVVTARLLSRVPVLVAARALSRGTRLRPEDLAREQRDPSRLPADALADPGRVVGRHAVRSVRAGAVLRERFVEIRPVVARGQLVALVYQSGALRIDGRGKAREDGRPGDMIRVQAASRREVSGRVGADGVVHVDF